MKNTDKYKLLLKNGIKITNHMPHSFKTAYVDKVGHVILPAGINPEAYSRSNSVHMRVRAIDRDGHVLADYPFTGTLSFIRAVQHAVVALLGSRNDGNYVRMLPLSRKMLLHAERAMLLPFTMYGNIYRSEDTLIANIKEIIGDDIVLGYHNNYMSNIWSQLANQLGSRTKAGIAVGVNRSRYCELERDGLMPIFIVPLVRDLVKCNRIRFYEHLVEIHLSDNNRVNNISKMFKSARLVHSVSINELANHLKINPNSVYVLESGTRIPTYDVLVKYFEGVSEISNAVQKDRKWLNTEYITKVLRKCVKN